jgi:hypothetical protein
MNKYEIPDSQLQKQLFSLSEESLQNSYNFYRNYFKCNIHYLIQKSHPLIKFGPDKRILHSPDTHFVYLFPNIFRYPKQLFPLSFPSKILYAFQLFSMRVTSYIKSRYKTGVFYYV